MPPGRAKTDEEKDAVLAVIAEAWKTQPHLRLGSLIAAVSRSMFAAGADGFTADHNTVSGLFYVEDGDLAHNLRLWAHSNRVEEPPHVI